MSLLGNLSHVAMVTSDLDAFIDFYVEVFDMHLLFRECTPEFRHAILRCGNTQSWLHPIEVADAATEPAALASGHRGRVDHVALSAASAESFETLRARLCRIGASDGEVFDLGAFHAFWFTDPDGTKVEVSVVVDEALGRFHAPVPMDVLL